MTIPKLKIDNASAGTPRQPVPLRYACLVTAWSPALLLQILGHFDPFLLELKAYECWGSESGGCHTQSFRELLRTLPGGTDLDSQLRHIPEDQFVWSDELANAFTEFIDQTSDRESEAEAGT